jgi:hypothetical protein
VSPIRDASNNTLRVIIGGTAVAAAVVLGTILIDPGGDNTAGPGTTTTTTTATTTTTTTTTTTSAPYDCSAMTPHTPGGPDGAGGCWPGPGNTGPTTTPTAVLAAPGGDRYVYNTTVTISDKIINYPILVQAGGHVTLHNVVMNGTIDAEDPTASMTITNSTIDGGAWIGPAITGYNVDVSDSETVGGQQPLICAGGCDWNFVYSHAPHYFPTEDAHQSAWATTGNQSGAPMSVSNSVLWCDVPIAPTGGGCTSNLALQPNFGPVENVTIHHNLLPVTISGGYCMTGGHGPSSYSEFAPLDNHVVVTDNVFGKNPATGKCGVFGQVDNFNIGSTGNVWTGNVFTDGATVASTG